MVHQAFWRKERVVDPTHLGMGFGEELLVSPVANVVTAAEAMADAEEHVPVAQLEEVWTGHVLVERNTGNAVGEQVAHELPFAFEGG